jgi:hypothetical protein
MGSPLGIVVKWTLENGSAIYTEPVIFTTSAACALRVSLGGYRRATSLRIEHLQP